MVNVCSGLRGSYTLEEMQDRLVVVVCNLKESKMQVCWCDSANADNYVFYHATVG